MRKKRFTYEVFLKNKQEIIKAVHLYGGSFMVSLAFALSNADSKNTKKLYDGWRDEWFHYFSVFAPRL